MHKFNKRISIFAIAFLIISMSITILFSTTNVEASIFGTKNYYLDIEKQNLKDMMKKYKDSYKDKNLVEASYDCKVNAEIGADLLSSMPEMQMLDEYLSNFEVSFNYKANSKDLSDIYYTSLISTNYDGKKVADVDIKSADSKTVIAFPGLSEKSILVKSSPIAMKFTQAFLGDDKVFEEMFGITRYDFNKMVEKYLKDIIVKEIPDENVTLNSKANFENIDCNTITFKMDQKVVADIYRALAEEMSKDEQLQTMLISITNRFWDMTAENSAMNFRPSPEEIKEQIHEQIQSNCDELNSEAENMGKVEFLYTVYFKDNGDIISRQYNDSLSDAKALASSYWNSNGEKVFELRYKDADNQKDSFELINKSHIQSGDINVGNLKVNIMGKPLLDTRYSYDKSAKAGNLNAFVGEIDGKINLENFNDSSFNYTAAKMNNVYFNIVSKKKNDDTLVGKVKLTSKYKGKRLGITVSTETKQSDKANLTKPQLDTNGAIELTDYLGLYEMGNEISGNLSKRMPELFTMFNSVNKNPLFNGNKRPEYQFNELK